MSRRDVVLAIVEGRLEEALGSLRRLVERADASGAAVSSRQFTLSMLLGFRDLPGSRERVASCFDEFAALGGSGYGSRPI